MGAPIIFRTVSASHLEANTSGTGGVFGPRSEFENGERKNASTLKTSVMSSAVEGTGGKRGPV